ncbi:MAG: hypothetical protein ACXW6J_20910 [Candidatus Binatia bacterium]
MASADVSKGLPTAQEMMEKLALAEAEKASAEARKHAAVEAEKKALLDKLTEPSGVSDEERMKRATAIIERVVANGLTEVQVYRFSNALCTDHGRAINQQEPGWEATLTACQKNCMSFGASSFARSDSSGSRSSIFPAGCRGMSA